MSDPQNEEDFLIFNIYIFAIAEKWKGRVREDYDRAPNYKLWLGVTTIGSYQMEREALYNKSKAYY